MRVYASVDDIQMPLARVPAHAQRAERLGYDGLIVPEAVHDGILISLLALEHTERLRVTTGVVVAFARSPMLLAQDAWGLAQLSGGRFELGLGPQVKGNVEKRFGMPWSAPAARMRDYLGALHAIFDCWQNGAKLDYHSDAYTLTRMQPFFDPGPLASGAPRIALGAIGPRMTALAGELADVVISHPTNATPAYLRDVMTPHLASGAAKAGRSRADIRLIANPMVATGPDAASVAAERAAAHQVLTFTYSTPAYRATLDHHGWGHVHENLLAMTRAGQWNEMGSQVSAEMLDVLVPTAPLGEIAALLIERYAGVADGISLRMPKDPDQDDAFARVVAALQSA